MDRLISPELRRNLWLEFSPARLVLMPAVLLIIYWSVIATPLGQSGMMLVQASTILFLLITVLWGTNLTVSNLAEEIVGRTWDWQRMSSITPFEMTLGKIIGPPAYAWYGGLLCLTVLVVSGTMAGLERVFYWAAILVGIALLTHAGTLLCAALVITKHGSMGVTRLRGIIVAAALAALLLLGQTIEPRWVAGESWIVTWYDHAFPGAAFSLTSVYLFVAWAWLGTYHVFRAELGLRNAPWAFTAFALFLMIYVAGFVEGVPAEWTADHARELVTRSMRLFTAGLVAGLLTLGMLLQGPHDPLTYRRLLHGRERFPAHLIPRWSISLALTTIVLAVWLLHYGPAGPLSGIVLVAWVFLIRDTAVIVAFNLRTSAKPASGLVAVYLILIYFVLPAAGVPGLLPQIAPAAEQIGLPVLQAMIALAFLGLRWRRVIHR